MNRLSAALLTAAVMASPAAWAASADDILGVWNNQEKSARIEIFKCAVNYCGRIISLTEPTYPAGSTEGVPGSPKVDNNNPDPALRKAPIVGLQILSGFSYENDATWKNGTIYDPKNGKTYSAKMTLTSPGELNVRGYIGISLIGRTTVWTR